MSKVLWLAAAALLVGGVFCTGVMYGGFAARSTKAEISPRSVDHIYGAAVTLEVPGLNSSYLRWCDPTGYLIFASSLKDEATLTVVRDSRCDGVGR